MRKRTKANMRDICSEMDDVISKLKAERKKLRVELKGLRAQAKWVKAWLEHAETKHPVAASCLWDWIAEAAEEASPPRT